MQGCRSDYGSRMGYAENSGRACQDCILCRFASAHCAVHVQYAQRTLFGRDGEADSAFTLIIHVARRVPQFESGYYFDG